MKRKLICFALSLSLFISLLAGISFINKTEKVIADEVEGIQLSVLKVWDDYNDVDELRPSSIEVTLYQNNQKTNITATLSANNNWYFKYNTLVAEKDNNGDKIHYTWKCDSVDDYERFEDDLDHMYIITDVHHANNTNINSVVLQKFNEKDEFFDGCNMRLKDDEGNTLITWTTNDNSSINTYSSGLTASMNGDGSLVVNDIPEGEYVYEEVKPKTGYSNAGRKEFKIEKGVHNYTFNWYTDLQDAVTDANNLNNNNADCYRDDEDCEAGLFIINNKAMLILLKDKSNCSTISLSNDTVFDLDTNDLSFNNNNQIEFKENLRLLEGNIITNTSNSIDGASGNNFTSSGVLEIEDIELNNNSGNNIIRGIRGNNLSRLFVNNSKINNTSSTDASDTSSNCLGISLSNTSCDVELNNSDIVVKTTKNTYLGLCCSLGIGGSNVEINNCNCVVDSTGYQCLGVRIFSTTADTNINILDSSIDVKKLAHSTNRNSTNASLLLGYFNKLNLVNSELNIETDSLYNTDSAFGVCLANANNDSDIIIKNNNINSESSNHSYGIAYQKSQKDSNSVIDNNTIISDGNIWSWGFYDYDTTQSKDITIKNNIMNCYSNNDIRGVVLSNCNCDMFNNNIRCELPVGVVDKNSVGVLVKKDCYLHYMSGILYSDISKDSSTYYNPDGLADRWSSTGHGIEAQSYSRVLIDESKGSTTVTGGGYCLTAFENSEFIVNGGTFKSPNYGSVFTCGLNGHCEINGGTFKNNPEEYSLEKLNGVHSFAALYLYSTSNNEFPVNIRNCSIIGGTHGLNIKSDTYYGASCHIYNSYIKGSEHDILLSCGGNNDKINNSYCYIENGTTFEHEGSNKMWYDQPFIFGFGQHIFDNRQQQTTQQETTIGGE